MKHLSIFILLTLYFLNIQAQDWETITTMNEVQDLSITDGDIWAATTGGVFSYSIEQESIVKYSNLDGLESVLLYAICADDKGQIIVGGAKGILEVLNISTGTWRQFYELEGNSIADLFYTSDTLWVAAGKGLAVYVWNGSDYLFKDYFLNFDELPGEVYVVKEYANKIWLGTDVGLLSAPADISRYTINDPALWTRYGKSDSLLSDQINALAVYKSELYVGTPEGLSRVASDGTMHLVQNWHISEGLDYMAVDNLFGGEDYLFASSSRFLYRYLSTGSAYLKGFSYKINNMTMDLTGSVWVGIDGSGFSAVDWDSPKMLDGPRKNIFRNVLKSKDGEIWAISGKPGGISGEGHYVYEDSQWMSYLYLGTNWGYLHNSASLYEDRFNNIWIGTWGGGLFVYRNGIIAEHFHNYTTSGRVLITNSDTIEVQYFDENSTYPGYFAGVVDDPSYEIISAINEDNNGRIWFANYWANDDKLLASVPYTNDGFISLEQSDWIHFGKTDGIIATEGGISCIEFDDYGRVWIGTLQDGVFVLDHNNTLTNKSDDEIYHLDMIDNLYSSTVYSIQTDHDGIVWIGTAAGLNSFDGVNVYKHVGDPDGVNGPLENRINQIFVDDYNNKWFATSAGLSILRSGNSAWEPGSWIGFNTENSGLIDDDVYAIYVDAASAEALIGTNRGLSIYRGSFAEIREDFNLTSSGPNPFIIDGNNNLFTIKNLQDNSTVKIFTVNGRLVQELTSDKLIGNSQRMLDGSRAIWDGKDRNGSFVSSGIYLYAAYTLEGESVNGKIAVIRK